MARTDSEEAGDPLPGSSAGRGERVSAIGLGGWHLALPDVSEQLALRIVRDAIDRGHQLPGQLLGLQRGRERAAHGQGAPRRLPRQGLPDDQDRRALEEGGHAAAGRVAPAPADRPHRPRAAPRDHPLRGPAPDLRRGRGATRRCSRPRRRASSATSASPDTRTRTSTCTCWRSPREHGFAFDAVQMPLNVMDAHYRSFEKLVLPELVEQSIGVLGMKSMAQRLILKSRTVTADRVPALRAEPAHLGRHHRHATAWRFWSRRWRRRAPSVR